MRQRNWRLIAVGTVLLVLAALFILSMRDMTLWSNDPVTLMRTVGEVSARCRRSRNHHGTAGFLRPGGRQHRPQDQRHLPGLLIGGYFSQLPLLPPNADIAEQSIHIELNS
jgi:hypothetical protein